MPDSTKRPPTHETHGFPECLSKPLVELTGWEPRIDARAPEDFISHPIADARKTTLQHQGRLGRKFPMTA